MIFFSKISETLNIPETNHSDSNFENVRDPTLKAILKYCNYSSILARKEKTKSGLVFTFKPEEKQMP